MAIPAGALGNAFSEVVEKELNEDGGAVWLQSHLQSCSIMLPYLASQGRFQVCKLQEPAEVEDDTEAQTQKPPKA